MDNNSVYEHLLQANEWERRALEFIKVHGRIPSGKDLFMVYGHSIKLSEKVEELDGYLDHSDKLSSSGYIVYQEDQCFLPGSNIELCKVERYVDNIPHTHEFFEVEYVLKGSCIHIVEKQKIPIREGDIVIVPPNVEHKALPEGDGVTVNIKIRKRVFNNAFMNLLSTNTELSTYLSRTLYSTAYRSSFTFHCKGDDLVRSIILSMYGQQLEEKPFFNYILEGMMLTLFAFLMQNHSQDVEISNFVITNNDRMSKIIAYINENYRNVTLHEVAKRFYISEPYLSSIIKKETVQPFPSCFVKLKYRRQQCFC